MEGFKETHIIRGVPICLSGGAGYDDMGNIRFERDQVGRWYENGQPVPQAEVIILDMEGEPVTMPTMASEAPKEPPALVDMPPKVDKAAIKTSRTFRLTEEEWKFLHRHGVEPSTQLRADLELLMRMTKWNGGGR